MELLDWKALSADYAQYHKTAGNRLCHLVGIPLIVMAIAAWTRWPAGSPVPLAAAVLPVYFAWDRRLALAVTAMVGALTFAGSWFSTQAVFGAFIVGWVLQLAGHKVFEGKSPAFTRNLVHLLVGPAWILERHLPPHCLDPRGGSRL